MRVQGRGGRLLAGGRQIATVLEWEAREGGGGYIASARIHATDPFWLEQLSEFDVELTLTPTRRFFWRKVPVSVAGDQITCGVGRLGDHG